MTTLSIFPAPCTPPPEPFRLQVGWLFDGSGCAAQTDVNLEIVQGRIAALHRGDSAPNIETPDTDITRLTFSDATIMPWLVDCHQHLILPADAREVSADPSNRIEAHAAALVSHGILAVRDAGDRTGLVQRWYDQAGTTGFEPSLTVQRAGAAWHKEGRYGRLIGTSTPFCQRPAGSLEGADWFKIINSGLNSLNHFARITPPQFNRQELQKAIAAAHAAGRRVMVHANGTVPVRLALEAGCDSIEHGYFMGKDTLARLADLQIPWIPTLAPMAAFSQADNLSILQREVAARTLEHQLAQMYAARRCGVRMLPGTDAGSPGVTHGPSLFREMALWLGAGFPLSQIIAAASADAAAFLGLKQPQLLLVGAPASFVIYKGNPEGVLQTLRPLAYFMNGRRVTIGKLAPSPLNAKLTSRKENHHDH